MSTSSEMCPSVERVMASGEAEERFLLALGIGGGALETLCAVSMAAMGGIC